MFENLKKFRESTGMKQREFSKQLDMSFQTYNGYERGIREPKSDFWILVSTKYGVSIDYLRGRTDDPTPGEKKKAPPSEDDTISAEAQEVATAYIKADQREQQIVRFTLNLPNKK